MSHGATIETTKADILGGSQSNPGLEQVLPFGVNGRIANKINYSPFIIRLQYIAVSQSFFG